jgi:large subunit ribosomal protein L4
MEVSVLNINGQETGRKVTLDESIFGIEPNEHVLWLAVKQYLANQRQGTAKTKERSEHRGSTRKLGRQKGGGGAVGVILILLCSSAVVVFLVLSPVIIVLN